MKKFLSFLLSLTMILQLSGCRVNSDPDFRDEAAYDEQNGFADSLSLSYSELRGKYPDDRNDICFYIMAQEKMPPEREVKLCFTNVFDDGWREAKALTLTPDGMKISDERMIFTFGKHFPVETVMEMTGFETVDELFGNVGQVQVYEELDDFCAFSVNHYYERPEYVDTVYFGAAGNVKSVDVSLGKMEQPPDQSLQITENYVYYFVYDYDIPSESSVTIAKIPRGGGEVVTKKIFLSDIGFPSLHNGDFIENIFVDGDNLFMLGGFMTETLQFEFCIAAYNLKTDNFDVYKTRDFKGMGKLFRYGDGLGVMTALYDERGFFTDMGVRFLKFDEENCRLSADKDLPFAGSKNWAYDMSIIGKHFYCIGDTLCGVLTSKDNASSYMYVEIDLKTGAVATCVPFAKNSGKENKGLVLGSVLIRSGGRAVSEHNC